MATFVRLPPAGVFLDIGGGNGQLVAALQAIGRPAALLEPGGGVHNARRRGVQNIIHSTFDDAAFPSASLGSAGAFDVLEHIEDEINFLKRLREAMQPGARFYCTVPAGPWLWSMDDVTAGHHRRYTERSLRLALQRAGFAIDFISPFFTWLTLPVCLFRTLPSRFGRRDAVLASSTETMRSEHALPAPLVPFVERVHAWEHHRITEGRRLPAGTSLLCVARASC